ncbi:MAG: signal peptidase I [Gammaproteobacteria bacterium]|nr:signal peptidase I [Gammaproteobacteria bacterium]
MNFDFATVLVIATFVTGIIWAIDAKFWAPKRKQEAERLKASGEPASEELLAAVEKEPILVEYARSFFPVILIVLVLRSFIVEPFRIPSGSMMPTLLIGDFILVNKFAFGLRLPVGHHKIIDMGKPKRGDVIVFRFPENPSIDYIKRVVGLPGDRIAYRNKSIYVNGKRMQKRALGAYTSNKTGLPMHGLNIYEEDLDNIKHEILINEARRNDDGETIVPEGHYFVMGDNRDNSNDSRYWGTVPEENLVGRAFFIWMNMDFEDWHVQWGRIGSSIE